jgi:hypothetical protein
MSTNPQIFTRAATASATILLAGGLVTPASAFFGSSPYDRPAMQQPSEVSRPAVNPQRPMRPRAPITASRPPKDTPISTELADKAKGPLQIIISIDKQQNGTKRDAEAADWQQCQW